jgi:hypothetical protein
LEIKWNVEKDKFMNYLVESSQLFSDKEKTMEAIQMELTKAHL